MARIVLITTGLTGILNASYELASRLKADGHEVTCAAPRPVGAQVQAQGFDFVELEPVQFDPAPPVPALPGLPGKAFRVAHKYLFARKRLKMALRALGMDAFAARMRGLKPELVLIDIELHEHIMTLHTQGFRYVLLSQWFSLWRRPGLPPLVSDALPGNQAALDAAWNAIEEQRHSMFERQRKRSAGTDRRSVLLAYAQQVGFPLELIPDNYWPGPFTYAQLPVLSMTAQELEFEHDVRPNLTYIGPMVAENRVEKTLSPALDQKLAAVLAKAREKQLIYCSVSTFKPGDTAFLERVVEAVSGQADWQLIISLGGLLESSEFAKLPENVAAFASVPQLRVLREAALSINHGGIHTINECMHFGVPMLVYSGKRSDQPGCAARVHHHGLGRMADKDLDGAAEIRANIAEVLQQPSYKQRVLEVRAQMQAYKSNRTVEQFVRTQLNTQPQNGPKVA